MSLDVSKAEKHDCETFNLGAISLFETVESFSEFAYLVGARRGNTRRDIHVYIFMEFSIKESIINVKLLDVPMERGS